MRLINSRTLELHEFFDSDIPKYVILSHIWGKEELTFQDWLYVNNQNPPRWGWVRNDEEISQMKSRIGYAKVEKACQQARQDNCDWIWVDKICIDKTSSAELSEAINSMFKWYEMALICYAFLADVPDLVLEECYAPESLFRTSRWFARGWTLQELIGPMKLEFYSQNWTTIRSKSGLTDLLADITTVPKACLEELRCV